MNKWEINSDIQPSDTRQSNGASSKKVAFKKLPTIMKLITLLQGDNTAQEAYNEFIKFLEKEDRVTYRERITDQTI